ncbi:MAG: hypothetical protein ABSB01_18920 [Streptosporangiaceae bacterium]|jgi:hypothetical protein
MKIKIRRDDASTLESNEWLQTNDWIAELRESGRAEPPRQGHPEPPRNGGPRSEAAASYASPTAGAEVHARTQITERAAIGDQLRLPVAWCEMGSCIRRHADRAALGEADIRARAILAGWRVDALGRLACPRCQQNCPGFRASRPVVLWDRNTAIIRAGLMLAAVRSEHWRPRPCPPAGRPAPPEAGTSVPRQRQGQGRRGYLTGRQGDARLHRLQLA